MLHNFMEKSLVHSKAMFTVDDENCHDLVDHVVLSVNFSYYA